jgi:dienelactone hydrolase
VNKETSTFHWPDKFATTSSFEAARETLRTHYLTCLGEMPEQVDLNPRMLASEQREGFRRELVEYTVEKDEAPVRAYVCIPNKLRPGAPAVVCLHQHGGQFALGKSEQVGRIGSPHQQQALDLAKRGFITIAADSRCFEERNKYWDGDSIYGYSLLLKGATLAGRFIWDIQREFDYLASRPEVNADLMGLIGHSMGSQQVTITLPLEPRIKVAVASQGAKLYSGMLTRGDSLPQSYVIPGLLKVADLDALLASFAPKPLLMLGRSMDNVSPLADQQIIEQRLQAIYDLYGAGTNFAFVREPGGHLFSPPLRQAAYNWLEQHLKI